MKTLTAVVVTGALVCLNLSAFAEDWPQWMGPGRDNVWRETGVLDSFGERPLPVVWQTPVAGGYAGPAVAEGKVFVTDYITEADVKVPNWNRETSTGIERVLCLNEKTGEEIWRHEYPVKYTISYPAGPRCTPSVHNGKVYTLGAEGNLFCLDVATGDVIWSKNFPKDYGAKTSLWGYVSSTLVDGNRLICVVGGEGSHAVAFDLDTGNEIWRSVNANDQGYSPPTIINAGGVRQLILLCPDSVTSVDPETGREYWSVPYQATSGSIIMSPVQVGNYLYVGGYNNQSLMLELSPVEPAAEIVWGNKSRHGISPVNVQPFAVGNTIYGVDSSGELMAVSVPSGERLWKTTQPVSEKRPVRSGTAFLVKQEDRFWMFTELGELVIAKLSPEGFEEIDRTKVIEPSNNAWGRDVVWCMPAFANRRMYVRNDDQCICIDLAAK